MPQTKKSLSPFLAPKPIPPNLRLPLPQEDPPVVQKGNLRPLTQKLMERWESKAVLNSRGYVVVPNLFLRHYASLHPPMTTAEAMFILQLMSYKWTKAYPNPSLKTIAKFMNVSDKMVRRYAQNLEAKHYIRRIRRPYLTNEFDLSGIFYALHLVSINQKQDAYVQRELARTWAGLGDQPTDMSG